MPKTSKRKQQILQWFETHKDTPVTPLALSHLLGINYDLIRHLIRDLVREGKIIQLGRGLYAHPSFKSHRDSK